MAKNKKPFKKKQKVAISDRIAGCLFEEILETLLKRYRESAEKETISFEEYCNKLINLSKEKRQKKGVMNDYGSDGNN